LFNVQRSKLKNLKAGYGYEARIVKRNSVTFRRET